jgi:hypothetical protein
VSMCLISPDVVSRDLVQAFRFKERPQSVREVSFPGLPRISMPHAVWPFDRHLSEVLINSVVKQQSGKLSRRTRRQLTLLLPGQLNHVRVGSLHVCRRSRGFDDTAGR